MIRLTIRQMQYFDALAQTLHFGKAAKIAGVSQPALSAQIAEMEERLGCQLFDRSGKSVHLTEEARVLRPRIQRVLLDMRELEAIALRGRQPLEGRFRLGIIPTVAPYLLPHALPELRRRFPNLVLELREAVTASLVEGTLAGRIDGFIAALPLDQPGLEMEELFTDRFFLAVPSRDAAFKSPPIPPASPALERLMLLEEGHCMRDQALAICGSVTPTTLTNYGATSLTTLLQMVAHGLGLTLIPEMAVPAGRSMPDLKIVPFSEPVPVRNICLAWRRNGPRTVECLELATVLRQLQPLLFPEAPASSSKQIEGEGYPHEQDGHHAESERRRPVRHDIERQMDEGVDIA